MKRFTGTIGFSITLAGALVALVASLAALLLVRLQDSENERLLSLGESFLLSGVLVLAAAASFALIAVALVALLAGGGSASARSERSGSNFPVPEAASGPAASGPGAEPTSPGHAADPRRSDSQEDGRLEEDGRWTKLVEECVEVVDEFDGYTSSFDAPRREVAEHVISRLEEVLGRSGVEIISNEAFFDRARHSPDAMSGGAAAPGAAIRETLSPGFAVGRRVLRRARVRVE